MGLANTRGDRSRCISTQPHLARLIIVKRQVLSGPGRAVWQDDGCWQAQHHLGKLLVACLPARHHIFNAEVEHFVELVVERFKQNAIVSLKRQ